MKRAVRSIARLFAQALGGRRWPAGAGGVPPGWAPTHRHWKGGEYRVLGQGKIERDRSDVVIYDDAEGRIWVRPVAEFHDGRFEPLTRG